MKDTNKHSFEEEFRKVFEEAEATPSPVLWAEIDAHLANQEAARYKRRLLYFKLSAVAAAVLLFGFLGVQMLNTDIAGNSPTVAASQATDNGFSIPDEVKTKHAPQLAQENTSPASTPLTQGHNSNSTVAGSSTEGTTPTEAGRTKDRLAIQSPAGETSPVVHKDKNKPANEGASPALPAGKISARETTASISEEHITPNNAEALALSEENTVSAGKKPVAKNLAGNSDFRNRPPHIGSGLNNKGPYSEGLGKEMPADISSEQAKGEAVAVSRERYLLNQVPVSIAATEGIRQIQPPAVQIKANPYSFWPDEEEEEQKKSAGSKWSLALAFTPGQFDPNMQVSPTPAASANAKSAFSGYNDATLSTGQTASMGSPVSQDLQDAENFGLSYNVGLNVQYALSEKFSLQSGLQYIHNNSQITTDNYLENFYSKERYPVFLSVLGVENASTAVLANNNFMMEGQVATVPSPTSSNTEIQDQADNKYPGVTKVLVQNLYQYMSIPFRLQYKLLNRKLSTSVGAGLAADLFLKNTIGNTEANVSMVEVNRQNNTVYKALGISGLLSARVNYQLSGKYSVYVEPSYRAALSSFTRSAEVKSLPNTFGVGTGLQYKF